MLLSMQKWTISMVGYVYCPYRGNRGTQSTGGAIFLLL
jgi:hypothetical protein